MKNYLKASTILALILFALILSSCKKEEKEENFYNIKGSIFITNEGNWGSLNGSITFYNPVDSTIKHNIYEAANSGVFTGDVVQCFSTANNKGYIVLNASNMIKIVNLNNFEQINEIAITYPRYFLQINSSKAYITAGSIAGHVYIMDIEKNKITDSIAVGNGPENLVISGKYAYIANCGGFDKDSTISVIDIDLNKVVNTVEVGENPTDLVIDAEGNIWVICKGFFNDTWANGKSTLVKLNHSTLQVEKTFEIGTAFDSFDTKLLAISSDSKTLYYQEIGGVFALNINANELPAKPLIASEKISGIDINPKTGDIYCSYSGDYSSAGKVIAYDKNGVKKNEIVAGIGTSGVDFNY